MDEDVALAVWVGRMPALLAAVPSTASPLPLDQACDPERCVLSASCCSIL